MKVHIYIFPGDTAPTVSEVRAFFGIHQAEKIELLDYSIPEGDTEQAFRDIWYSLNGGKLKDYHVVTSQAQVRTFIDLNGSGATYYAITPYSLVIRNQDLVRVIEVLEQFAPNAYWMSLTKGADVHISLAPFDVYYALIVRLNNMALPFVQTGVRTVV